MQLRNHARSLAAGLALAALGGAAHAQITIDLASTRIASPEQDKVILENVRVTRPDTTQPSTYNVIFTYDPASMRLVPSSVMQTSGAGARNCATANVGVYSSVGGQRSPVSEATVSIGPGLPVLTNFSGLASLTNLPEGVNTLSVSADGFNSTAKTVTLSCASVNTVAVGVSPMGGQVGSLGANQFRTVLTWGRHPVDLDAHFTGPSSDGTRFHIHYGSRTGGCSLDADTVSAYGPETATCPPTSTTGGSLTPGVYRYSVHHYAGDGTIGTSGAHVRLEMGNGRTYSFSPPASGWEGSKDVWTVFELTVASDGSTSISPVNRISNVVHAPSLARAKPGAAGYGTPEDPRLFRSLVK